MLYSDINIAGTAKAVSLKKDGYIDFNATIRKDQFALGPCIGGCLVTIPFIWILGYKDAYEFELEPATGQQPFINAHQPIYKPIVRNTVSVEKDLINIYNNAKVKMLKVIGHKDTNIKQSTIVETTGYACMGESRSRMQTELAALKAAKRKAIEFTSTYMISETHTKNFVLEEDLVSAYANATVKIIKELYSGWYKDANLGECFRTKIEVEVIPK